MKSSQFHVRLSKADLQAIHEALVSSGNADLASLFNHKEGHSPEEAKYVSLAREYCNNDLEIDVEPLVSIGDNGAWVAAWVWVDGKEEDLAVA